MENKSSQKSSFSLAFAVASVWFGAHVGGGFATGNQTKQYFVQFGWPTIIVPFLVICLLGWCYYNGVIMAKNYKVYRYDEFAEKLYAPFSKSGKIFFDIAFFVLVVVGAGIAIAGGGSLFLDLFNLNYYIGITFTGFVFLILTIFGAELVRKASSVITLMILICLIVLLIPGLISATPKISEYVKTGYMRGTWLDVLWNALLYSGFQSLVVASIVSTSQKLDDDNKCKKFAIIGTLINGVMIALCSIMILGYLPEVAEDNLPILSIVKAQNIPALTIFYSIGLFAAFVSTGVGVVFGLVARFENVAFRTMSLGKRRALISFISIFFSVIISMAGLTKLVAKGYGEIGRICIFLLVIPLAVIAPIKNRKFKKEHSDIK